MINLLLGAPGGGKSYEAVAYHVIPALAEGRKVITNLPLNLDCFPPEQRRLIEIREKTKAEPPVERGESREDRFFLRSAAPAFSNRAFANPEDYGDNWRHPETGAGPLYVIDECHLCLPRQGTPKAVPEWFSLHRHEFADVLLITQSYGKLQKDIVDLVQVCYRVRKASALGFSSKYIRKVFDGVRGECMNENIRTYDSAYFKFYRSHTRSSKAGQELEAKDITPIWKHWSFKGAMICGLIVAASVTYQLTKEDAKGKPKPVVAAAAPARPVAVAEGARTKEHAVGERPLPASEPPGQKEVAQGPENHPLAAYRVHIAGYLHSVKRGHFYLFSVSQNGQKVFSLNSDDMTKAGYEIGYLEDCIARVTWKGGSFTTVCDAPSISVGSSIPSTVKASS